LPLQLQRALLLAAAAVCPWHQCCECWVKAAAGLLLCCLGRSRQLQSLGLLNLHL
jgi:hypothetical protein